MAHAHKAVTIQGVVEVLLALGWLGQVLAQVGVATRSVLENPHAANYHPGSVLDETLTAVAALHGFTAAEQVMTEATRRALTGIIGPLAKLLMTLSGGGPRVLLERFETLASGAGRGFKAKWLASSPTEGELVVSTELVTPEVSNHAWKGTAAYLLTFAGVEGTVTILPRGNEGRDVRLGVKWVS